MKILGIRGENLASLPKVELALEAAPLSETSLFAITGPTGAGKSTLLDALCLALYDRVPRLVSAREAAEGDLELPASDPRSVVRRGAASAMAQVDFRDKDGKVLRATWEAWRARRKATGKLQPQRLSLLALEGEVDLTGATKTETLALIRERVGLSFDEFRRAVLLAQGDFAAFLAAKPDERAALLERMTGTDLYARLSARAFERAKEEDLALRALEDREQGLELLLPDARAEIDAQLTVSRQRQDSLHARAEGARAQVAWYETARTLEGELDAATVAKATAEAAWAAAEPQRRALAEAKEAELLRPAQRALRTAEEAEAKARARLEQAETAAVARQAAIQTATAAAATAESARRRTIEEITARAPEVATARALDGQLREAGAAEAEAKTLVDNRLRAALEAREALRSARDGLERLEQEREKLDAWLESQAGTKAIAAQWPRWSEALERYREAHARAASAAELEHDAKGILQKSHRREQEARARLEEVGRRITAVQTERRALSSKLATLGEGRSTTGLTQATALLAEHRASVEAMKTLALDARRAHTAAREAAQAKAEAETSRAEAETALATLDAEAEARQSELERARREAARADVLRDLAARREALLVPGAPCPLCGATDHPAAHAPAPSAAEPSTTPSELADALASIVQAQQARAGEAQRAALARDAAAEEEARAARRLQDVQQTWARYLERLEQAWLESPLLAKEGVQKVALLLPRTPKLTGSTTEAADALAALDRIRGALLEATEEQSRLSSAIDACREKEEGLQSRRGATQAEVDGAAAARAKSEHTLAEARTATETAQARMAEALATLDEPFSRWPGWPNPLVEDPEAFVRTAQARVAAFETRTLARQALEPREAEARRQATSAAEKQSQTEAALTEAKATHATRTARTSELRDARSRQLRGEEVEAWERAAAARREAAESNSRTAVDALGAAKEAQAAAQAELQSARSSLEEATRTRAEEARDLDAALARSSVPDRDTLVRMLDRGTDWLEVLETELADLDAARVRAETTHADRASRLETHRASGAPEVEEAEAKQILEHTREDLEQLVDELAALRAKITADDEAQARLADLLPKIRTQRATLEQWSEMSALIGSSDGKKLRTFAQGLTLDVLVEQSNLHMRALRPRYTLRRMRGQAMELTVVDHDLGDEVRFISTLSGGERFLVSLALALGLSTLSSRNVRIESLFIDEGFGALDPDSLEVALATLDQLQAEGRTVGIISHVPDLADRIGYRVEVRPTGPGTSEVRVVGV